MTTVLQVLVLMEKFEFGNLTNKDTKRRCHPSHHDKKQSKNKMGNEPTKEKIKESVDPLEPVLFSIIKEGNLLEFKEKFGY
jgi:hypothetical protein